MNKKIILGTVQFGLPYGISNTSGRVEEQHVFSILDFCLANGILCLDTAAAYGSSEEVIGSYLRNSGKNPFRLITKLQRSGTRDIGASLAESIKRLSVGSVDTLLFHSFSDYESSRPLLERFLQQFKGRLFNRLGVSVYTNEEIEQLAFDPLVEVVQAPFNLLDNVAQRRESLLLLKRNGKEVHTRSVFLQGLFFKDLYDPHPVVAALSDELTAIGRIAEKNGLTMTQLALGYSLGQPFIDGVLIGVDSLAQLKVNVLDSAIPLSDTVRAEVDGIRVGDSRLLNPSNWQNLINENR